MSNGDGTAYAPDQDDYRLMRQWIRGAFVFASVLLVYVFFGGPVLVALDVEATVHETIAQQTQESAFIWVSALGALAGGEVFGKRR